jgi:hypothetical protein
MKNNFITYLSVIEVTKMENGKHRNLKRAPYYKVN